MGEGSRCAPPIVAHSFAGMASLTDADQELKARHRTMWASGNYPEMVETFLAPLGPRLVEACRVGAGVSVLDVGAGTGNAAIPAARRGAHVTASDLTPELLQAGARAAAVSATELEWVAADAEQLPFEDESYDIVMSSIGVMFAPHHQQAADELVRVCRPGGTIGVLSWTPEGQIGALFRTMKPFAPPPPPGAQAAPLWGSEEHLQGLFGGRVEVSKLRPDVLVITRFHGGPGCAGRSSRSPPRTKQPASPGTSRTGTARPSPPVRTPWGRAPRPSSTRRWR